MRFNVFRLASAAGTLLLMAITVPAFAEPVKNIVLVAMQDGPIILVEVAALIEQAAQRGAKRP